MRTFVQTPEVTRQTSPQTTTSPEPDSTSHSVDSTSADHYRSSRIQRRISLIPVHPPLSGVLQTKLSVNQSADEYEREADRVADQVTRMSEPTVQRKTCACGRPLGPDGMCDDCRRKKLGIQRMARGSAGQTSAPPIVHQVLRQQGRPLEASTRSYMEPRFGRDFKDVRVHTGEAAAASARQVNGRAYTVGQHMVFDSGQYDPSSSAGRKLIAHELAHVVQQRDSRKPEDLLSRADPDAVSRVGALSVTAGTGIQFVPSSFVADTVVGPVSGRGGLLSSGSNVLNVIIGENLTPRILARLLLPMWTTATPFTPPGGGAPVPLVTIDEETLAKALLVFNQYYLPLPAMTNWRSGLRFPVPVEIDFTNDSGIVHPDLIQSLATAFDPAWTPLLDSRAAATVAPPAADLAADVTAFLGRETTPSARGTHLAARALTNASAEQPFIHEAFQQMGADGFDAALEFMNSLVMHEAILLMQQQDGIAILTEIQTALNAAPATISERQQESLDRANRMLGPQPIANPGAEAPPAARRTNPEKTVTVDTLKLVGSTHNPATQISVANAVFSQCNIRIEQGVAADDSTAAAPQTTTWLGGDTDIRSRNSCRTPSPDERRLYRDGSSHYGLGGGDYSAFFAATVSGMSASGYTCRRGLSPSRLIRNKIVVLNSGSTDTLAHELGHQLINQGPHRPTGSIMAPRPRNTIRLTDWQCNRAYRNA